MPKKSKTKKAIDLALGTGAEWNYTAGVPFSTIQAYTHAIKPMIGMELTLGWNYLDGLYAVLLGTQQLLDREHYRQTENKIKGMTNMLSGMQLFALSYNPVVTAAIGLAGGAALAPTSFAIAMLCDLVSATIDFMHATTELTYEGWVSERLRESEHMNKRLNELAIKIANATDAKRRTKLNQKYCAIEQEIKSKRELPTKQEWLQNAGLQNYLSKRQRESAVNLGLKATSFVGMSLIAAASFVACPPLLAAGIAITSIVAATYIVRNVPKLYRFFMDSTDTKTSSDDLWKKNIWESPKR